ncbi:MAG: thioredoxin-dependent thiol peroxidase [Ignavibacteriales bacterium]|nr:thioredoxin-dependent thiol peroxidase [Ignavibacteriales bacterium]
MLNVGDAAPQFKLPSGDGQTLSLKDFKGKKVVLYFYPKDDTPGCTREACSFQKNHSQLLKEGAVVLGVSADNIDSHQKFANKYGLSFPLLSDESKEVVKAYDVWRKKSFMGREYMGIERTTFVIDEKGKIQNIFRKVKVDGHTQEVMEVL